MARHHPKGDVVDRFQKFGLPPPCYPSYGASDFCPGGTHLPLNTPAFAGHTTLRADCPHLNGAGQYARCGQISYVTFTQPQSPSRSPPGLPVDSASSLWLARRLVTSRCNSRSPAHAWRTYASRSECGRSRASWNMDSICCRRSTVRTSWTELPAQPCSGEFPVADHSDGGNSQGRRCFLYL